MKAFIKPSKQRKWMWLQEQPFILLSGCAFMSSSHSAALVCTANGAYMSCCGWDFMRKNKRSNRSWKLTLNAPPTRVNEHVSVADPVCMYQADRKVCSILDEVCLLKMSTRLLKLQLHLFSRCVFEERRQTDKKKTVVVSVHLSHVLRLVFPSTQNATHLSVCLEMGRFGINPSAAQLGLVLLCVCSSAFRFILRESWQHDDANVWLFERMHRFLHIFVYERGNAQFHISIYLVVSCLTP